MNAGYFKIAVFAMFVCLLLISCNNKENEKLKNALKLAGPNKKELKKALDHYKKDPADSLKYKAACFMIENMQWHFGKKVEPDLRLWDLFVLEDSLVVSYMRNPDFYKNKDAFNGYKYRLKKMFVKEAISLQKWVGLDLGVPRNMNRIRIAPRNAHNGIVPGDNYQLLYWNNGWVPAEIKQADYHFIEFENIPSNTLYWLRNLDHGKEEQPFFYRNGKQVFSNQAVVGV